MEPAMPILMAPGIYHLGVEPAVDARCRHVQDMAVLSDDWLQEQREQLAPQSRVGRIASELHIVEAPRLLISAPTDELDLQPIALHIAAGGYHLYAVGHP